MKDSYSQRDLFADFSVMPRQVPVELQDSFNAHDVSDEPLGFSIAFQALVSTPEFETVSKAANQIPDLN